MRERNESAWNNAFQGEVNEVKRTLVSMKCQLTFNSGRIITLPCFHNMDPSTCAGILARYNANIGETKAHATIPEMGWSGEVEC